MENCRTFKRERGWSSRWKRVLIFGPTPDVFHGFIKEVTVKENAVPADQAAQRFAS